MKRVIHTAENRGFVDHGWLKTYHSFSFGSYYNPERMGFGLLRVLNDDRVEPGYGFETHHHENMEIVSLPLEGELQHQDSMGNGHIIRPGEIQRMSAGSGIDHSEWNPSKINPAGFLQIWVFPREKNTKPSYEQKAFDESARQNQFQCVVSPDGREKSLTIGQDAFFSLGSFSSDFSASYEPQGQDPCVYVFVIEGRIRIAGETLGRRDALGMSEISEKSIAVQNSAPSKVLIIEVPYA